MALTERQQEIVDLQKQGLKTDQIAAMLSITPNAVYQHIRRMRESKGETKPKATAKTQAAKKTGDVSATGTTSTTTTTMLPASKPLTPLQSLRLRRDEIEADIKSAKAEAEAAARAATKADEVLAKINARHAEELGRLDAAEAALKGTTATTAPPKLAAVADAAPEAAKSNGKGGRPTPKAIDAKKAEAPASA